MKPLPKKGRPRATGACWCLTFHARALLLEDDSDNEVLDSIRGRFAFSRRCSSQSQSSTLRRGFEEGQPNAFRGLCWVLCLGTGRVELGLVAGMWCTPFVLSVSSEVGTFFQGWQAALYTSLRLEHGRQPRPKSLEPRSPFGAQKKKLFRASPPEPRWVWRNWWRPRYGCRFAAVNDSFRYNLKRFPLPRFGHSTLTNR